MSHSIEQYQREEAQTKPYRTAQDDLNTWAKHGSAQFQEALEICKDKNNGTGDGWQHYASTWEKFVERPDVVSVDTLTKDFIQTEEECPQRPTDVTHLLDDLVRASNGYFDHRQAGAIPTCFRSDGTSNSWDAWHTLVFAVLAEVSHVRIDPSFHPENMSIKDCRIAECELFEKKNGRSKKVGEHELFTKRVAIERSSNLTAKESKTIALMNILDECNISTNGSKKGATVMLNFGAIKQVRKDLHAAFPDRGTYPDEYLKKTLKMIIRVFPAEKISGFFLEGLTDFMLKFRDIKSVNHKSLEDFFSDLKPSADGKSQLAYVKSNENIKGRSRYSISVRICTMWNDWIFENRKSEVKGRRPITATVGIQKYFDKLPHSYLKNIFDAPKDAKVTTQCPQCDHTFTGIPISMAA